MRMRHKPNLERRLKNCADLKVEVPDNMKGSWRGSYTNLFLEIGCGKGSFTCDLAKKETSAMLVAIEKVPDAMVMAMEKAKEAGLENVRFIDTDAKLLKDIFADGEVDRIYLNFSDPWPKSRDAKFRLTAPAFLRLYADVLPLGGEIRFKTDNRPLFDWSLEQLEAEGWELKDVTDDLKSEIMTDYEKRFVAQGVKINGVTAIKKENTKSTKDGVPERLRNASLSDARGC